MAKNTNKKHNLIEKISKEQVKQKKNRNTIRHQYEELIQVVRGLSHHRTPRRHRCRLTDVCTRGETRPDVCIWMLFVAVRDARGRKIGKHQFDMQDLYLITE